MGDEPRLDAGAREPARERGAVWPSPSAQARTRLASARTRPDGEACIESRTTGPASPSPCANTSASPTSRRAVPAAAWPRPVRDARHPRRSPGRSSSNRRRTRHARGAWCCPRRQGRVRPAVETSPGGGAGEARRASRSRPVCHHRGRRAARAAPASARRSKGEWRVTFPRTRREALLEGAARTVRVVPATS